MTAPLAFDIPGIQSCQRNRYPLLFVNRVFDVVPGEKASGVKCFTYNEWFFPAHFDDDPNVPGFIQMEALVQTFIMTFLSLDEYRGKKTNFLNANQVSFKRKIVPGETLTIHAQLRSLRRGIAAGSANGFVGEAPACAAEFLIAIPDVLERFKPRANP